MDKIPAYVYPYAILIPLTERKIKAAGRAESAAERPWRSRPEEQTGDQGRHGRKAGRKAAHDFMYSKEKEPERGMLYYTTTTVVQRSLQI